MQPVASPKITKKNQIAEILEEKIRTKSAQIGVVGLGYVGLPLAVAFAKAQFSVKGIDLDSQRINQLSSKKSYISDVSDKDLAEVFKLKCFENCLGRHSETRFWM